LEEFGLTAGALDPLRAIVDAVAAHRVPDARIVLDFGLGRGLHYYTGAIFEIYDQDGLQLCGGGRYDDLVTALGGRQPIPAVGFAYGLERVVLASKPATDDRRRATEVLVVPADDDTYPYALEVAQILRERGYIAAVDVRGRTVASNLRDGARRGYGAIAVVGADERADAAVIWRDLATRAERRVILSELPRIRDSR
jgi:histidyl-tRNA synthetase